MQMIVKVVIIALLEEISTLIQKNGINLMHRKFSDKLQRIMAKIDFPATFKATWRSSRKQKNGVVPIWVAVNVE